MFQLLKIIGGSDELNNILQKYDALLDRQDYQKAVGLLDSNAFHDQNDIDRIVMDVKRNKVDSTNFYFIKDAQDIISILKDQYILDNATQPVIYQSIINLIFTSFYEEKVGKPRHNYFS